MNGIKHSIARAFSKKPKQPPLVRTPSIPSKSESIASIQTVSSLGITRTSFSSFEKVSKLTPASSFDSYIQIDQRNSSSK